MHCICFQNLTKKAKKKRYNFIANRLRISTLHLPGENTSNEWLEAVSDEEYDKFK